jgi:hypothetical protein
MLRPRLAVQLQKARQKADEVLQQANEMVAIADEEEIDKIAQDYPILRPRLAALLPRAREKADQVVQQAIGVGARFILISWPARQGIAGAN